MAAHCEKNPSTSLTYPWVPCVCTGITNPRKSPCRLWLPSTNLVRCATPFVVLTIALIQIQNNIFECIFKNFREQYYTFFTQKTEIGRDAHHLNHIHPTLNIHRLSSCIGLAKIVSTEQPAQETSTHATAAGVAAHEHPSATSPGPRHPFFIHRRHRQGPGGAPGRAAGHGRNCHRALHPAPQVQPTRRGLV